MLSVWEGRRKKYLEIEEGKSRGQGDGYRVICLLLHDVGTEKLSMRYFEIGKEYTKLQRQICFAETECCNGRNQFRLKQSPLERRLRDATMPIINDPHSTIIP